MHGAVCEVICIKGGIMCFVIVFVDWVCLGVMVSVRDQSMNCRGVVESWVRVKWLGVYVCRFEWTFVDDLRGRKEGVMRGGEGSLVRGVCLLCCVKHGFNIVYTERIRDLLKNHQVVRYS